MAEKSIRKILQDVFNKKRADIKDVNVFDASKYPIKIKGNAQQKKKAGEALDVLMQSETGKKLVENAASYGYVIAAKPLEDVCGYCISSSKTVLLNYNKSSEDVIATLAHELRHVEQGHRGLFADLETDNIKSQVIKERATEADADVMMSVVLYELKEKGHIGIFEKNLQEEMALVAFDKEINNSGNIEKAKAAAFKGWYGNKVINDWYDNYYFVDGFQKDEDPEIMKLRAFSASTNPSEYLLKLCEIDGKNYMSGEDKNILNKGKFIEISREAKENLDKYFVEHQRVTWRPADTSYQNLPIRGEEQSVSALVLMAKKQER
ncbi:MAG: DUF6782 family putative metallopeptidase [Alphaproteobacteria bacterium]